MQKYGGVKFRKDRVKFKFGVNPQSFFHELCLYITRFRVLQAKKSWAGPGYEASQRGEGGASNACFHS